MTEYNEGYKQGYIDGNLHSLSLAIAQADAILKSFKEAKEKVEMLGVTKNE